MSRVTIVFAAAIVLAPRAVRADEPPPVEPPDAEPPPVEPTPPAAPTPAELADRIEKLEGKIHALETEARRAKVTREQVQTLLPWPRFLVAFVDVGAFAVGGDGSGIRSDLDHLYFPKYAHSVPGQWVFMGDPLSTAINSLDEPADTSDSREEPNDALKSKGHPSVIVNSVGLALGKDVGYGISVSALVELLPRPGSDSIDIELAHIDYRPFKAADLIISAGKLDSVLGVEYRTQDALRRVTVTPSLICRYTCGRPIGVQARLTRELFSVSAALTDGDNFETRFEPETAIHSNAAPTAAAHLQYKLPFAHWLWVGTSGAIGSQDNQPNTALVQWHYGFDFELRDASGFDVTAEFVQGLQPGQTLDTMVPCDIAPCLHYKGAYVLVDHRTSTWLNPYVRFDWRDAVHESGASFVYESHVARATVGARFRLNSRIVGKIEYTFNRELDGIPQFPDDVLTSSIVVQTD